MFFVVIFGSNYTVFIKFVNAILPKSRRTIIDYQLNSLLENCLNTELVVFGWATPILVLWGCFQYVMAFSKWLLLCNQGVTGSSPLKDRFQLRRFFETAKTVLYF